MEITKDTKLTNDVKVYCYCIRKDYNIPKIFEIFEGSVWENGYFAILDKKLRDGVSAHYIDLYARKFTSREEAEENFKLDLEAYLEELEVEFEKEVAKLREKIDKKKQKSLKILNKFK